MKKTEAQKLAETKRAIEKTFREQGMSRKQAQIAVSRAFGGQLGESAKSAAGTPDYPTKNTMADV